MFDSFTGLPLHPLVVHAVVVSIPLSLLLSIMFAVPRFRSWARWALPVVAVGAFASSVVAKLSGGALYQALGIESDSPAAPLLQQHMSLADQLVWFTLAFAILAVICALTVGRVDKVSKPVGTVLVALLLVAGLLSMIWVARVGDVGSRAVWNPTGQVSYEVGG